MGFYRKSEKATSRQRLTEGQVHQPITNEDIKEALDEVDFLRQHPEIEAKRSYKDMNRLLNDLQSGVLCSY